MSEEESKKYHKGKKIVWLDDEYHRLLKIMAVQSGKSIKEFAEDMIEGVWIDENKK